MRHPEQWHNTIRRTRTDPTRPPRSPRGPEGSRGPAVSHFGGCRSGGPIPATVWVCGRSPSDLDAGWPPPVVEQIVTSFTDPGGHVLLLPWPTSTPITPALPDHELRDALSTVRSLERIAQVIHTEPEPDQFGGTAEGADLVITSLSPKHSGDRASDQVAFVAARLLRTGGVLAVLTHSDWSQGQLIDPTGAVVTAAQNADLLYLQHIVLVHAPVRDGEFVIEPETTTRTQRHRQTATHRKIHTNLLIFAQPHDHHPAVPLP
jgi:hypothetical protein